MRPKACFMAMIMASCEKSVGGRGGSEKECDRLSPLNTSSETLGETADSDSIASPLLVTARHRTAGHPLSSGRLPTSDMISDEGGRGRFPTQMSFR